MPIKRTAWACQYKCGRNVTTSRKRMEEHEARCWFNPVRRACVTCKNFTKENDGDDFRTWTVLSCAADDSIFSDEDKKLRHDCPLWESKCCGEKESEGMG